MKNYMMVLNEVGGPEKFHVVEQPVTAPKSGEVRVRHEFIGTNFLDIYHRQGIYALPAYPAIIGAEAAGFVEDVGHDVKGFKSGDRVAYAGPPVGTYCSVRNVPCDRLIKLPETVSSKTAASSLLKGMTAYMLLHKVYAVQEGVIILVHAAAGGLGSILVRWAKSINATIIGTVSSNEKASKAASYGADHLIIGREADLVGQVKQITNGLGVHVAYDGIGGETFLKSIRSVRPFGCAVTIGQAAGPVPPVSVEELRPGKSLCHPSIMAWCSDTPRYQEAARAALFAMEAGIISEIAAEFELKNVASAHREMESGRASGSILLVP